MHSADWAIIKTRDLLDIAVTARHDTSIPSLVRPGRSSALETTTRRGMHPLDRLRGLENLQRTRHLPATDGHPGVSGGGILDQAACDLVGIPIGRMQGAYQFSIHLPLSTRKSAQRCPSSFCRDGAHAAIARPSVAHAGLLRRPRPCPPYNASLLKGGGDDVAWHFAISC